ncbi:MAG: hypothetical protein HYZ25_09490 [Chloroflexi bacterium]|nr:hypothetical protein [Chloroflexota bacterium]
MEQKITFNGKTYDSLEQMPPNVRQAYESVMQVLADKNQNGVPDLFEGTINAQATNARIVFNGQAYEHIDQLPPEAREKYEKVMGQWDKDHNGIPDFAERIASIGLPSAPASTSSLPPSEPTFSQSTAIPVSPSAPNLEPEQTGLRFGILAVMLLALLCMGGLALWFLSTQLL